MYVCLPWRSAPCYWSRSTRSGSSRHTWSSPVYPRSHALCSTYVGSSGICQFTICCSHAKVFVDCTVRNMPWPCISLTRYLIYISVQRFIHRWSIWQIAHPGRPFISQFVHNNHKPDLPPSNQIASALIPACWFQWSMCGKVYPNKKDDLAESSVSAYLPVRYQVTLSIRHCHDVRSNKGIWQ